MRKNTSLFYKPKPKALPKPKRKWVVLPFLWRAVKYTCMSIGAAVLLSIVMGFFMTAALMKKANLDLALPDQMILYYKLDGEIAEGPAQSGFDAFGPHKTTLREMTEALEAAKYDPRVKAFLMSVRQSQLAVSQIQELRQAVESFRKDSGKPAYIYSLSYGESGQGLSLYSLAAAFDEIWLAPLGTVSINGLRLEQPYARGLMDRLGVEPQFFQREEYKGLFESVTHQEMSDATRESLQSLSESLVKQFIKDILETRPDPFKGQALGRLINQGIFLDTEAKKLKLVDRVEYGDVLLEEIQKKLGGSPEAETPTLVPVASYVSHPEGPFRHGPEQETGKDIAVIYIQGPIMVLAEGQEGGGLMGKTSESADTIAGMIVEAGKDDTIGAVVLRVDSPGGSPTASELIRRAVVQVRGMGKPVIVSMGSMAASGGYWVSASADYIFALPGTLTGSIGVAGGKVSLRDFWQNIDVSWDHVGIGQNAGMYSMNTPFSDSERERMNASMDRTYSMFLQIVAEGRHMTSEQARNVAKGRVWSGAQALENGLVDKLGGLNDALDYAAVQAGYKSRKDVNVIILPEAKTPLEEILELLQQNASLPLFLQKQEALLGMMTGGQSRLLQDAAVMQHHQGQVMVYDSIGDLR
ncbi:MAG: signal peptide peptidase SppA [Rhodospirillales bacterium]|nr:signal peptide peptidase SppA [Rhodospirillales bacterium]